MADNQPRRGARPQGRNPAAAPSNAGNPTVASTAGVPQVAFPPPIPVSLRNLIDGTIVSSISVTYTRYGISVLVHKTDGTTAPLEQYQAEAKTASTRKLLAETRERFAARVSERNIAGVLVPAAFADKAAEAAWLGSLTAEQRRLVTMTNREFRAQQGNDAVHA